MKKCGKSIDIWLKRERELQGAYLIYVLFCFNHTPGKELIKEDKYTKNW